MVLFSLTPVLVSEVNRSDIVLTPEDVYVSDKNISSIRLLMRLISHSSNPLGDLVLLAPHKAEGETAAGATVPGPSVGLRKVETGNATYTSGSGLGLGHAGSCVHISGNPELEIAGPREP